MNRRHLYGNERGMALPVALLFLLVLATAATTATIMTTTDLKIASSYRSNAEMTTSAEAGIEEARGRLRAGVVGLIDDIHPSKRGWAIYIGGLDRANSMGYHAGKHEELHSSLQSDLDYIVRIDHQIDADRRIEYYGDSDGDGLHERNISTGENIYRITSSGYSGESSQTIEAEVTKIPPIDASAALYLGAYSEISGDFTVNGMDSCGNADKLGIVSSQPAGTVDLFFYVRDRKLRLRGRQRHFDSPVITGAGGTTPNIVYSGDNRHVNNIVKSLKDMADFSYHTIDATHYPTTSPGPGDDWGTPTPGATLTDPSSCTDSHIVHYHTDGSYLVLRDGVSGCGILMVEGDLVFRGDFSWYGVIIVTGSVTFRSEGNRNITGAVIAQDSVDGNYLGGSTSIVYCSSAVTEQTANRPLKVLSWKE